MNNIYIISDLHLGHVRLAEKRGFASIEEHDAVIITNWNSVVDKKDTVWVLGDVVFGGSSNLTILNTLKGYKKLVMGNHDRYPSTEYLKYFSNLYGAVKLDNYILTHIPVHTSQKERYLGNIHGHLHDTRIDLKHCKPDLPDTWYTNVSCEALNYTPVLLNSLNPYV
jgi:calcineurin-like phosphoesterase family protein